MASRNQRELVKRVLQKLFVVSASEEPKAEDAKLVSDIWNSVRLELAMNGTGGLEDDAIPYAMFEAVADVLAARSAQDFGIAPPLSLEAAMKRLNAVSGVPYSGKPVQVKYY